MNYWLHRISHHAEVSDPLLKKGILSIGWQELSSEEFIAKCRGDRQCFEKTMSPCYGLPRNRHCLWRFITDMKKGDIVLVPSPGAFSIYEITEDLPFSVEKLNVADLKDWHGNQIVLSRGYLYRNAEKDENLVDLGFFRTVKPLLLDIPRDEYADAALTARMKIRPTNAGINDLAENVRNAMRAFELKKPINLHAQIIEKMGNVVLGLIRDQLNPAKFEKLIKWYFRKCGATLSEIPSKNEPNKVGDADIVATFEPIKTIVCVQAKFHQGDTPDNAVDQIKEYKSAKDVMDDGYARVAWVISSADGFTKECINLAQEAHVILVNGPQFVRMLLAVGLSTLDDTV